jgi:uncharacterized membrane protein
MVKGRNCKLAWKPARLPKIRGERPKQLAERGKTLSRVVVQVVSVIVVIIAFVMIISGLGVDITPILASLGVASLAPGFAALERHNAYFPQQQGRIG